MIFSRNLFLLLKAPNQMTAGKKMNGYDWQVLPGCDTV
jgi:hypothetical protein